MTTFKFNFVSGNYCFIKAEDLNNAYRILDAYCYESYTIVGEPEIVDSSLEDGKCFYVYHNGDTLEIK